MTSEAWRRRQTVSRVFELCDHCQKLAEGVESRTHRNFWPTYQITLKSCAPCFETAKREKAAEFDVTIC